MLDKMKKNGIITQFRIHDKDTGSPEVQIAILSTRINELGEHLKSNQKDHNSRRGLLQIVNQRRRLLDYLKESSFQRYKKVITDLNIRK